MLCNYCNLGIFLKFIELINYSSVLYSDDITCGKQCVRIDTFGAFSRFMSSLFYTLVVPFHLRWLQRCLEITQ